MPTDGTAPVRRDPATDRTVVPSADQRADTIRTPSGTRPVSDSGATPSTDRRLDRRLKPGEMPEGRWGDFQLMEELGRGGMGVVFRARQISLDREVALKLMLGGDEEYRQRFQREGRALAQVDSPHVVKVHFSGVQDGQPYFVMEYLVGTDLSRRLKSGWRPTAGEALGLVLQAAIGLSAAGERGIVHRDIKPANLMITDKGVLKLMDFGLVRMAQDLELTNSGVVIGTVNYFSPEQARGQRCDQRSDIYSLGVVFYQLLCNRLPFTGDSAATLIYHHVHSPPEPMAGSIPPVPAGHEAIALRCLRKDPAERYQSAAELVADLEQLQRGEFRPPHRVWSGRRIALLAVLAVAAGAAVLGADVLRSHPSAGPATSSVAPTIPRGGEPPVVPVTDPKLSPFAPTPTATSDAPPDNPQVILARSEQTPAIVEPTPPAQVTQNTQTTQTTQATEPKESTEASRLPAPTIPASAATGESVSVSGTESAPESAHVKAAAPVAPAITPDPAPANPTAPATVAVPLAAPAEVVKAPPDRPATVPAPPAKPKRPAGMPARAPGLGEPQRDANGYVAELAVAKQVVRFRWCPPGMFTMGSPESERERGADERQHQVTLTRGFWIADRECTQALWLGVTTSNPSTNDGDQLPVNNVTREECRAFCAALARLVPGLVARLPWEAEWEYACRAGTQDAFPGHAMLDGSMARIDANGPKPVGSFAPNPWGMYDLAGNVGEWCEDAYGDFPPDAVIDPHPTGSGFGVSRGGFWEDSAGTCRAAKRFKPWADKRNRSLGLRLVVEGAADPRK